MQYIPELLTELKITRPDSHNSELVTQSINTHQEFIPMDFKRTVETERVEHRLQQDHIQRIRDLNKLVQEIYGGQIITDYELKKLGPIEVITFMDETAIANQALEQRLSVPTTFIYGIKRYDEPEYLISVFHPLYVGPIHIFVNENNIITRVAVNRGDPRSTRALYYGDLTEFFKELPLDYVQENLEIIHEIKVLRSELGF